MKLFRGIFLFAFASLLCCFSTLAQSASLPSDYSGPTRIDLSGLWDFKLDTAKRGETQQWFDQDHLDSSWSKLAVPGSFNELLALNAVHPEASDTMRFFKGSAWYRTAFTSPIISGKHCYLHLSGTVLRHTVWINGRIVGHSERPYLDESYDITPLLNLNGFNSLAVEVNNEIPSRGIPDTNWHGWWDDGGLIRPVYLELRPSAFSETHINTKLTKKRRWQLDIQTTLSGTSDATTFKYELADSSGSIVWRGKRKAAATINFSTVLSSIHPWSPEHPALYTLTTITRHSGQFDHASIRIGFRQIEVRDTRIYLNGKAYPLRGISRHQFLAGAGMSLTKAQNRADIVDIKSLGANFVRLAHYTQSQDVYDACDELGLLVWTEIPAWQSHVETLADATVWETSAEPQLRGMVEQHRNHPSVVIWSVANEIPSDLPLGAAYVNRAIAYVKSLDSSRLITFASDRRVTDRAFDNVDVISINEYFGWYYGKQDDVGPMLDEMHRLFPHKPILVSEFGSDAIEDWNPVKAASQSRNYSYDAQTAFLKRHMEQIFAPERGAFVAGGLIWVYNDFPDPQRIGGDHPPSANFRNNKGLVTMERVHKPFWMMVKRLFELQEKR